jgi:hypothetical protein
MTTIMRSVSDVPVQPPPNELSDRHQHRDLTQASRQNCRCPVPVRWYHRRVAEGFVEPKVCVAGDAAATAAVALGELAQDRQEVGRCLALAWFAALEQSAGLKKTFLPTG